MDMSAPVSTNICNETPKTEAFKTGRFVLLNILHIAMVQMDDMVGMILFVEGRRRQGVGTSLLSRISFPLASNQKGETVAGPPEPG